MVKLPLDAWLDLALSEYAHYAGAREVGFESASESEMVEDRRGTSLEYTYPDHVRWAAISSVLTAVPPRSVTFGSASNGGTTPLPSRGPSKVGAAMAADVGECADGVGGSAGDEDGLAGDIAAEVLAGLGD